MILKSRGLPGSQQREESMASSRRRNERSLYTLTLTAISLAGGPDFPWVEFSSLLPLASP